MKRSVFLLSTAIILHACQPVALTHQTTRVSALRTVTLTWNSALPYNDHDGVDFLLFELDAVGKATKLFLSSGMSADPYHVRFSAGTITFSGLDPSKDYAIGAMGCDLQTSGCRWFYLDPNSETNTIRAATLAGQASVLRKVTFLRPEPEAIPETAVVRHRVYAKKPGENNPKWSRYWFFMINDRNLMVSPKDLNGIGCRFGSSGPTSESFDYQFFLGRRYLFMARTDMSAQPMDPYWYNDNAKLEESVLTIGSEPTSSSAHPGVSGPTVYLETTTLGPVSYVITLRNTSYWNPWFRRATSETSACNEQRRCTPSRTGNEVCLGELGWQAGQTCPPNQRCEPSKGSRCVLKPCEAGTKRCTGDSVCCPKGKCCGNECCGEGMTCCRWEGPGCIKKGSPCKKPGTYHERAGD